MGTDGEYAVVSYDITLRDGRAVEAGWKISYSDVRGRMVPSKLEYVAPRNPAAGHCSWRREIERLPLDESAPATFDEALARVSPLRLEALREQFAQRERFLLESVAAE